MSNYEPWAPGWDDEPGRSKSATTASQNTTPESGSTEPTSWEPVDLGPYLRGEVVRPAPTIGMPRSDGLRLIYPGKEHSVIGEMESGKSWFMLGCAAAEILAGNNVIYIHFEEEDPGDTLDRMIALDVPVDAMLQRFHFIAPHRPVAPEWIAQLTALQPTLAILDGINEGMSLHAAAIRDEDGVALFRRRLVKPFTRAGAAVLGGDHVVKDKERRDRGPLGSIHKGNALSGTLILLENAEPFGRKQKGRSRVYITKDRPGYLRQHGSAERNLPGKTYMGDLVVDDTRMWNPWLELKLWAPAEQTNTDKVANNDTAEQDTKVLDAVRQVIANGNPTTKTNIRAVAGIANQKVTDSLARLVMDGRLHGTPIGNNAIDYREGDAATKDATAEQDSAVLEAVRHVISKGQDATPVNIRAVAGMTQTKVIESLARLVMDGHLAGPPDANAKAYTMPSHSEDQD